MKTKLLFILTFVLFTLAIAAQGLLIHPHLSVSEIPSTHPFYQEQASPDFTALSFNASPTTTIFDSVYDWHADSTKKWVLYGNTLDIVYDSDKDHVSSLFKTLKNQVWANDKKYTTTYDSNKKRIASLTQKWNGTSWINYSLNTNSYAGSLLTAVTDQEWNTSTNDWNSKYNRKRVYSYDGNGNQAAIEYQNWTNNAWVGSSRVTLIYDSNNKRIKSLNESFNNSTWTLTNYQVSHYDAVGNAIEEIAYMVDSTAIAKFSMTYDNANRLVVQQNYDWDYINKVWYETWKSSSVWDSNNNIINNKTEQVVNGKHIPASYYLARYTPLNQITDESWGYWNETGTAITTADSSHFFIHSEANGINDSKATKSTVVIYPNPSNGTFTINLDSKRAIQNLEVYNVVGERILQQHLSNQLSIPNAQTGIYFVKIDDGYNVYTKKITVQ